jgi:AraC-like DNA-binding protein
MIEGVLSAYLPHDAVVLENMWEIKPFFERLHAVANEVADVEGQHEAAARAFFALVQALHAHSKRSEERETRALENMIEADISHKWTVGELAAHAFRSPSQINRMFRRDTGMAPYEYILSRRLARAKLLLSSTSMQIREIADSLGFCDEHYFTSLFKEKVGVSPGEYRRGDRQE